METVVIVVITVGALVSVGILLRNAMNRSPGGCACGFQSCHSASECTDQANIGEPHRD